MCKSVQQEQYLAKNKPGIKNQYLNDGYGIGNHGAHNSVCRNGKDQHRNKQDDSTDYTHNEDHGYKYGHPGQPSTRCEPRQNSQHYSSDNIQKKKENCTPNRERRPRPRVNLFQHPEEVFSLYLVYSFPFSSVYYHYYSPC